jgi:DNA repair exonuclease SbcCD nuclease subunit
MNVDGRSFHFIGDPHLGKDFNLHAPIHRRGERAVKQLAQFENEHYVPAEVIIQVGDLFDHPMVSREIIKNAADICLEAAEHQGNKLFVHMAGNHDRSRSRATGAWELFKGIVSQRVSNLMVVDQPTVIDRIALFPWEWDKTAEQQLLEVPSGPVELAVGHWDLKSFNGNTDHLCPVSGIISRLKCDKIVSGHYHKAGVYQIDGVEVICTGSMQPYAHGEGDMYVTLSLTEALSRDDLVDKCVRLVLEPGEDPPDLDCLALTWQRNRPESTEVDDPQADEGFDFQTKIKEVVAAQTPEVATFIRDRLYVDEH